MNEFIQEQDKKPRYKV